MRKPRQWSESELETMKTMRAQGRGFRKIAAALGCASTTVEGACNRLNIHILKVATTDKRVIETCKVRGGLSVVEIAGKLEKNPSRMIVVVRNLTNEGRLFKAGSRKQPRYFADVEDSMAYAERYKKEVAEREQKRRQKKNKAGSATRKAKRAKKAKALGKPAKKLTDKKPVQIHITSKAKQPAAPVNAKIVWPEHVKVQAIPTPPPRFAFTPPPGWRGQITHDWMDRRLGAAS
jgi:hypothetical protein